MNSQNSPDAFHDSGVQDTGIQYEERTTTETTELGTGTTYGVNTYEREFTLRDQSVGITPQFGSITYVDAANEVDTRAITGIGLDFNLVPAASDGPRNAFFGISTGALFSHLGSPNSNFWGSNDEGNAGAGSNMVLIPANLKLGLNASDSFRWSLRGGGNLIYRSASNAAKLGEGSNSSGSSWNILPNVGMDFEWQVGDHVAIMARPDFTIRPGGNMFVGTLGATLMPSF